MNQIMTNEREFALSGTEFLKLTGLIHDLTGIVLGDHKKEMLYGRLARRLRALGMQSFSQYCTLLDSSEAENESAFLVNAVTTNLTKFFRESHHFGLLEDHLSEISTHALKNNGTKSIRIWSAGCSSGEEPYSIAATILGKVGILGSWDVRILATDLDTNMLEKGRCGIYPISATKDIPVDYRKTFQDISIRKKDELQIKSLAKNLVHFKQLNLLHEWPMKRKYDAIFCRNVLIYFDGPTKDMLVQRYVDMLHPGGMLFLGHSESLVTKIPDLKLIGRTAYRKEGG